MPRPIWKGHISFGLVNIPVTLFSAEQSKELSFKMLDSRNNSPIKYQRVNEKTREEVPWDKIVKGYEYEAGEYVLLGDEDFKRAAPEASQSVDIESFVPTGSIPPEYFEKPYYLVPSKKGERAFALLRETLKRQECMGIAKVVIRTKQYLSALMVRDKALVLEILRFEHELREAPAEQLPTDDLDELKINDKELALAEQLVTSMKSEWDPSQFKDEYTDSLMAWIDKKVKAGETQTIAKAEDEGDEEAGGDVIDMMSLLKRSMEGRKKNA